jgi:hypothetical protein
LELPPRQRADFIGNAMDTPAPSPAPDPASTAAYRPLWRRVLKWLGLGVVALVLLAVALVLFENWRAHRAWARFVAEAAAAGDDLSPESVIPPPVPDEENFAAIPLFKPLFDYDVKKHEGFLDERVWRDPEGRKRLEDINPWPMEGTNSYGDWRLGEFYNLALLRDDYRADTNFPSRPTPQSAGADVLHALSNYDAEWAQLRAAAHRPHARFPHQYTAEELLDRDIQMLKVPRNFSRLAEFRAVAHLAEGNLTEAREDIIVGLRFCDALAIEPILLSHLVAQVIPEVLTPPIWEGLVRHQWTEADLIALEAALARTDLFKTGFNSIKGERNLSTFAMTDWMAERPGVVAIPGDSEYAKDIEPPNPSKLGVWWSRGFVVHSKAISGKLFRDFLRCADFEHRRIDPKVVIEFETEVEALSRIAWRKPYHILGCLQMNAYSKSAMNIVSRTTTVDLTRVVIALERHRLRHGGFPESLEALDAAVLPAGGLPHDLVTGGPLRYRRTDNGRFDLYAVGWNGTDDGGVTAWTDESKGIPDRTQGDWVWPQPAE